MKDEQIEQKLRQSLAARGGQGPGFRETWLAAEARFLGQKRRMRRAGGIAVVAVLAAVLLSLVPDERESPMPELLVVDDLMSSTLWSAPSDVLIPRHEIDLYQDISTLIESTELPEGTLL